MSVCLLLVFFCSFCKKYKLFIYMYKFNLSLLTYAFYTVDLTSSYNSEPGSTSFHILIRIRPFPCTDSDKIKNTSGSEIPYKGCINIRLTRFYLPCGSLYTNCSNCFCVSINLVADSGGVTMIRPSRKNRIQLSRREAAKRCFFNGQATKRGEGG